MGDWLAEREAKRARRTAGYREQRLITFPPSPTTPDQEEARDNFLADWLIAIAEQVRAGEAKLTQIAVLTEIPENPGVYALELTIEAAKIEVSDDLLASLRSK